MILKKVEIKNFRSIVHETVDFDPSCQILLGVNETGKSNFLKALRLLDPNKTPEKSDVRRPHGEEYVIEEAWVDFLFSVTDEEIESLLDQVEKLVICKDLKSPVMASEGKKLNLRAFCRQYGSLWYRANVQKEVKSIFGNSVNDEDELLGEWLKLTTGKEETLGLTGGETDLYGDSIIDRRLVPKDLLPKFTSATIADFVTLIKNLVKPLLKDSIPEVIWWTYDEALLLPNRVSRSAFTENPQTCLPLLRLFQLAGYREPEKEIDNLVDTSPSTLRSFLESAAQKATARFKKVWPNCGDVQFSLYPNGTDIDIAIRNTYNYYDLDQRSDGFKRFVTFLLLVSAKNDCNQPGKSLLLIDEPDISLHPSGSRFLRDELIRLGSSNLVVYSTHSIFMIDSKNINRHLLVSKKNEATVLTRANKSLIADEEVLYNSLEYSVFENLKSDNILFEGWRDKHLFKIACQKPSIKKWAKNNFGHFGYNHSQGIKQIPVISSMFGFGSRNLIIISDADKPAVEAQERFRKERCYGKWFRYDEVLPDSTVQTSEDFIHITHVLSVFNRLTQRDFPNLPIADPNDMLGAKGVLAGMDLFLQRHAIGKADAKSLSEKLSSVG